MSEHAAVRGESPSALSTWLDLALVAVLAPAAVVLGVMDATGALGPLRVLFGLGLVFFFPGYAVTAALYPAARRSRERRDTVSSAESLTTIERLVMSVGLSIFLVPIVVLFWNFTPQGIATQQVLASLDALVNGAVIVAAYRRWRLDPRYRFRLPLGRVARRGRETLARGSPGERAVSLLLVALVAFAVVGVPAAVAVPKEGERYTEFYLLSENETGAPVADGYPSEFVAGQPQSLHVGIGNEEGEVVEYSVVVELQEVATVDGNRTVGQEVQVDRFSATIQPGVERRFERQITADGSLVGEDRRLAFHLYRGEAPTDANATNAYRTVYLWVDVSS